MPRARLVPTSSGWLIRIAWSTRLVRKPVSIMDLALEPALVIRPAAEPERQELHRFDSPGDPMLDAIYGPHSARAEQVDHDIVAESVAFCDRQQGDS